MGHQVKQCHDSGLLGPTCWVVFCLDALLFEYWKLLKNRLTICELWIMNSVIMVTNNYGCVKYPGIMICDMCRWLWNILESLIVSVDILSVDVVTALLSIMLIIINDALL